MNEIRERLIQVYASGVVDDVHQSADYLRLCDRYENDRAFDAERQMVADLRGRVDDYLGSRRSYRDQVEFALRLLWKLRQPRRKAGEPRRHEACRELILRSYGARWEGAQLAYFNTHAVALGQARHYFLSFTNRNPNRPSLNLVNRDHRYFIIDVLGENSFGAGNQDEQNLVAKAVHALLRRGLRDGFYYPEHEGSNEEVAEKLRLNCARSLAFVQLIQGEMFRSRPGRHNWCYFEFRRALELGRDRILFVQIEPEIPEEDIDADFDEWFGAAAKSDPIVLRPTPWHREEIIDENHRKISEGLSQQIDRHRRKIYQGIPD